jgi:hypothetical protein
MYVRCTLCVLLYLGRTPYTRVSSLHPVCMYRCMHKKSTPEDRAYVQHHLPIVMTKLEMKLPLQWNTIVVHIFVFHTIHILESCGPYVSSNLMDIERFHTEFKKLARGKVNVMASIKNHYEILEASLQNRGTVKMVWTSDAPRSSMAGMAEKPDSAFKTDRCVAPLGSCKDKQLSSADFKLMQDLWAIEVPAYDKFKDQFEAYNRNSRRQRRPTVQSIAQWTGGRKNTLSEDEKLWQGMNRDIKVEACVSVCVYHTYNRMPYYNCMIIHMTYDRHTQDTQTCMHVRC